jgi:DNA gyrase B
MHAMKEDFEKRIASFFGLSNIDSPLDFFDAIASILQQSKSSASHEKQAATDATANLLRIIVKKLGRFDLGQEWVQETKFKENEALLQASLTGAFLLGSLTADAPSAEEYRKSILVKQAAVARLSQQTSQETVTNIVNEEFERYLRQNPSSQLSANNIASKIMNAVNERLAEAKRNGLSRIDRLSQNAIAKRIKGYMRRTASKTSN